VKTMKQGRFLTLQFQRSAGFWCFCMLILANVGCRNPFFPPTSIPVVKKTVVTPATVINELMTAYENRRLDLYADLFLTSEFRFYVSPSFSAEYSGKVYANPMEAIDSAYRYIYFNTGTRGYFYWVYDFEQRSTEKLFMRSTEISFLQGMRVETIGYTTGAELTDTIQVEIVVREGASFKVIAQASDGAGYEEFTIDIGRQVFYLKKDEKGLWKIYKWFDLGANGN